MLSLRYGSTGVIPVPAPPVAQFTDFKQYLSQPGDQVITIPDGTTFTGANATGTVTSASHPATFGSKGGFLIIRAATPGGVVVDGTTPHLAGKLDLGGSSRILFDGIYFKNLKLTYDTTSSSVRFWYCDHQRPDYADWDPAYTPLTIPRYIDQLRGSNHSFYGCDFHAGTATIMSTNTDTNCRMQGVRFYDHYERVTDPNDAIHAEKVTTIKGPSSGFTLQDYYFERTKFIWGAGTALNTTIASGSNGQSLPQATINVLANTQFTNFSGSGSAQVETSNGFQTVTYGGKTSTSLTNCTGGTGVMSTGNSVFQAKSGGDVNGVTFQNGWFVEGFTIGGQWIAQSGYHIGNVTPCVLADLYVWTTAGGTSRVNYEAVGGSGEISPPGSDLAHIHVNYSNITSGPPPGLAGVTNLSTIQNHVNNPALVWRANNPRSTRDTFFGWS